MEGLEFYDKLPKLATDGLLVVVDDRLSSKSGLMEYFARALEMPAYFGRNWDALNDMLSDLSWLGGRKVLVSHMGLPKLGAEDLKIYVKVLRNAANSWAREDDPKLFIAFLEKDKAAVLAQIAQPPLP